VRNYAATRRIVVDSSRIEPPLRDNLFGFKARYNFVLNPLRDWTDLLWRPDSLRSVSSRVLALSAICICVTKEIFVPHGREIHRPLFEVSTFRIYNNLVYKLFELYNFCRRKEIKCTYCAFCLFVFVAID